MRAGRTCGQAFEQTSRVLGTSIAVSVRSSYSTNLPDFRHPELKARCRNFAETAGQPVVAELTAFRVGGPAQVLFTPADEDDLAYFLAHLASDIPVYVVGVGSDLIVRDGGIAGVVVWLAPRAFGEASATAMSSPLELPRRRARGGSVGLRQYRRARFDSVFPPIGGALRMNAGADGGETKDVLIEATGVARDGSKHVFSNADMKLVYRNSGVDPSIIFTSARFAAR